MNNINLIGFIICFSIIGFSVDTPVMVDQFGGQGKIERPKVKDEQKKGSVSPIDDVIEPEEENTPVLFTA
jgi:hypothetical protein